MEMQYYGANCVRISTKKATIIVDDNLAELGQKSITKAGNISLFTGAHGEPAADVALTIDQPGEYEVSDVSLMGTAARAHIDVEGQLNATIYRLVAEDIRLCILGHVYPELSDDQLEAIGTIDALIIPIGGNGYTLDGIGALKLIKKIDPKLIVPTHYADPALNYPVPQTELSAALKNMTMEASQTVPKLKLKPSELTETTQLVVLERQ
jgi:L-ascorbate metabolism protein UlaG (beta-lactamase superfamily)